MGVDSASKYHWDRATGLEKAIVNEPASEISESKSEEKENDKTTTKSSTSSKSTTKSGPKILDFQRYLVSLDVKQYFAATTSWWTCATATPRRTPSSSRTRNAFPIRGVTVVTGLTGASCPCSK